MPRNANHFDYEYDVVREQELVAGDSSKRNWRGIAISVLVILVISSIVAAIVLHLPRAKNDTGYNGTPLSFKEFLSGMLNEQSIHYIWLQDKLLAIHDGLSTIHLMKIGDDGKIARKLYDSLIQNWIPSYNADYIAFGVNMEELYRHSAKAIYTIILLQDKSLKSQYLVSTLRSKSTAEKLRLFKWSPRGNDFAFVYENDIYYRPIPDDPSDAAVRITWNGHEGEDGDDMVSGVADWLYEEEIFHDDDAMWWSPDGRYLAFATFDNSRVKRMSIDYYPETGEDLYPQRRKVAYPKVGERLPNVTLSVWRKEGASSVKIKPPVEVQNLKEYYLFSVTWPNITTWNQSKNNEPPLFAIWANRAQNLAYISLCNVRNGSCVLNYVANKNIMESARIWVEPMDFRLEYAAGDGYFAVLPSLQSDGYYYKHVASIEVQENGLAGRIDFLTEGMWEVVQIVGYNAEKAIIFFTAASPLPRRKNLFSVSTAIRPVNHSSLQCLTCWMEHAQNCTNVNAGFSTDGDHHVLSCDGPAIPFAMLRKASTNETRMDLMNQYVQNFINNTELAEQISKKALPVVKYEKVDLEDGYEALARILFPPGYNESRKPLEQFPMVQFVYGGPNTQYVLEQWPGAVAFETYLASSRRYIVVSFDGRGSSNRGTKYKHSVYRNLGGYEVRDQMTAAKALANKLRAVDADRMAVWGWSYGGFAVTAMAEQGAFNVYKCAAAVAPVTDFRYYDAAYIERYMGLYTDPEAAQVYARTNLLANVSQIANGKFLLVHGTADGYIPDFQTRLITASHAIKSRWDFISLQTVIISSVQCKHPDHHVLPIELCFNADHFHADNVHFQNSAMLAEALTSRNIQFSYMVYTNGDHSLSNSRVHLHTMLDTFFEDCFKQTHHEH